MECVCAAPRVAGVVGSRDVPAEAGVRAGAPGSLSCMQVGVATISMRSASPFFLVGLLSHVFIGSSCWTRA
jgi:hypothetical protein